MALRSRPEAPGRGLSDRLDGSPADGRPLVAPCGVACPRLVMDMHHSPFEPGCSASLNRPMAHRGANDIKMALSGRCSGWRIPGLRL